MEVAECFREEDDEVRGCWVSCCWHLLWNTMRRRPCWVLSILLLPLLLWKITGRWPFLLLSLTLCEDVGQVPWLVFWKKVFAVAGILVPPFVKEKVNVYYFCMKSGLFPCTERWQLAQCIVKNSVSSKLPFVLWVITCDAYSHKETNEHNNRQQHDSNDQHWLIMNNKVLKKKMDVWKYLRWFITIKSAVQLH